MHRLPPPPVLGRGGAAAAAARPLNSPLARSQVSAARRVAPELVLHGSGDDCFRAAAQAAQQQQQQQTFGRDARHAHFELLQLMRQPSAGLGSSLAGTEVSARAAPRVAFFRRVAALRTSRTRPRHYQHVDRPPTVIAALAGVPI